MAFLSHSLLPSFFLFLILIQRSYTVTITMDADLIPETIQTCHDIPPGECCAAITLPGYCYYNPFQPTSARFDSLQATDIAAVWGQRNGIRACSGIPIETRAGVVGTWNFPATDANRAYGASYVRVPTRLPPEESDSWWLESEGMLGLVWGGGKWFSKRAALMGLGVSEGLRRREEGGSARRIVRGQQGRAFVQGPSRWRWPDIIVLNGTSYQSVGADGLVYRSSEGAELNITDTQDSC